MRRFFVVECTPFGLLILAGTSLPSWVRVCFFLGWSACDQHHFAKLRRLAQEKSGKTFSHSVQKNGLRQVRRDSAEAPGVKFL